MDQKDMFSENHPPKNFLPIKLTALCIVIIAAGFGLYFSVKTLIVGRVTNVTQNINGLNSNDLINGRLGTFVSSGDTNELKKFSNYDEFRTFMQSHPAFSEPTYIEDIAMQPANSTELSAPTGMSEKVGLAPVDYSKTNVQVQGVDEADIIKTDGEYMYAVSKKNLFILDARPADQAQIVATIAFDSTPRDMYVNGDFLFIYGDDDAIETKISEDDFWRPSPYSFVKIFNIADKKNPVQVRDIDFEGYYLTSRMIGDYVYFVSNYSPQLGYDNDYPVPIILENGKMPVTDSKSPECLCPDVYYFDIDYDSYNLTNVAAINMKDPSQPVSNQVYLLDLNQTVYVSPTNMYIAYTKRVSDYELGIQAEQELLFERLTPESQAQIREIQAAKPYILSDEEKMQKIERVFEYYFNSLSKEEKEKVEKEMDAAIKEKYKQLVDEIEKTVIHKLAIDGQNIVHKGIGEVPGYVLNQFSMDENDGYFRIATTRGAFFSSFIPEEELGSYSNVYVLDEGMNVVGKVEHLAPDERIYAARFMQGRVYLVTFEQIDPLFAIDLKDPRNPKVLGELKVPGFSSYLHPYNDNLLIGVGRDTETVSGDRVVQKGLKLSLFDVSDVNNLREVDTYKMGDRGSDSEVLFDHKAFLFSEEKRLLSLPVTIREPKKDNAYPSIVFRGAYVFDATENGFELKGKIDHWDGRLDSEQSEYFYGNQYYDNSVKRSLYIGDELYTFSNNYIQVHRLDDLSEVKRLDLKVKKGEEEDDFEIIN